MDPYALKLDEDAALSWGPTIPVPSVKEMVRTNPLIVPERYTKELEGGLQNSSFSQVECEAPIINFSLLAEGDENERKRLDLACREWGFFQMINHGVAEEVLLKMKDAVAAFFDLPLEVKKNYAMDTVEGYGQPFVVSEDQKLDWCDAMILRTLPHKERKLQYWPLVVPGFSETVERYSAEIMKLNEVVLANISVLLGLEKDGLKKLHGEMEQAIRMNYYPTCSRPDAVLGVRSHSDQNSITYLIQDDEISGLQIKHNGGWITLKPIPNAIVVNVGDPLEVWSNGLYKSIEHRAVTNKTATRISIATFILPGGEAEIGPIKTMVDNLNGPSLYKTMKYGEYFQQSFNHGDDGKTNINLVKN